MRGLMLCMCALNAFFVGLNVGSGKGSATTWISVVAAVLCGVSAITSDHSR